MSADHDKSLALLERYLDAALPAPEVDDLEQRLAAEPGLRRQLDALRRERELRQTALPAPAQAPAGFLDGVMTKVRAQPSRAALQQQDEIERAAGQAEVFARRLAVAALVLCGLALLFGWQALLSKQADSLDADSQQLRQIDQQVREMKAEDAKRR